MYKKFTVDSVNAVPYDKKIIVKCSYEINEKTVRPDSLIVSTLAGDHIDFDYIVKNEYILITLREWPQVNSIYQVIIDGTIENIIGEKLESSLRKKIMFKTEIKSKPLIVSPYNFEKLDPIRFSFDDEDKIGQYYVEIADNQRFYDCIFEDVVLEKEFAPVFPRLKPGQYYIRIRCQNGEEFGPWSKITTFIYKDVCLEDYPEDPGPSANATVPSAWDNLYTTGHNTLNSKGEVVPKLEDVNVPTIEVEDILEVVTEPENGETPNSFVFEFDRELDICFGDVVIIKREF